MAFVTKSGNKKTPVSNGLILVSESVFSVANSAGKIRKTVFMTTIVSVKTNTT